MGGSRDNGNTWRGPDTGVECTVSMEACPPPSIQAFSAVLRRCVANSSAFWSIPRYGYLPHGTRLQVLRTRQRVPLG
jgi:hypothetical protein